MTGVSRRNDPSYTCNHCRKIAYVQRGTARKVARKLSNRGLHVYACPEGNGWHCGHLPAVIVSGELGRGDVYPRKAG